MLSDIIRKSNLSLETLELLAEALNCSVSPFALYDKEFSLLYANQVAREAWPGLLGGLEKGYSIDEAIRAETENLHKSPTEKQYKQTHDYVHAALRNPKTTNMASFDGRYFKMSHHKIGDVATAGIGIDVTKAMANARALEKAQILQKQTIEALSQCLIVVDTEGFVIQFNKAYEDYVKSTGGHIAIGMNMKDRVRASMSASQFPIESEEFDNWYNNEFWARFNCEGEAYEEEYSLARGDHLLWRQHYIPVVGNIITITNITDIKNAQIAAKESERARSEFLANMSHEIRTPMNGVLGMAQLLANCDLGPKEKNFVKTIQRSGEALVTIINDILDFSKIDSGHIMLQENSFCLNNTIEDIALLLSATANDKGVDLFVNIQPGLPNRYVGDEGRLRQVLMNLIGNAVKFTDQGHVVMTVEGQSYDGNTKLDISVVDTGIGIPEDQLETVFQKFRQVDGTTSRKHEGTGLGLSIARQLVELMGGEICVNSVVGKGTTFTISLSLPHCDQSPVEMEQFNILNNKNILVVAPHPLKQKGLKDQLSFHKAKAISVGTVDRAVSVLKKATLKRLSIDLVIVSGETCLQNIESLLQYCKGKVSKRPISVISLSSIGQDKILQSLKSKDVDAYLTYPLQNKDLLKGLVNVLDVSSLPNFVKTPSQNRVKIEKQPVVIQANDPPKFNRPKAAEVRDVQSYDVLVAEDNEVNQMYVEYILQETSLRYKIVVNGEEAVEAFKSGKPKIILMDVSMPVMNGFEATRVIRDYEGEHGLTPTPIVALTAHAMAEDRKKCLAAGMDDYVSKPIPKDRLLEILDVWVLDKIKTAPLKRAI